MEKANRQSGLEAHQPDVPAIAVATTVPQPAGYDSTRGRRVISLTRRLLSKAAIDRAVIYGILSVVRSLVSGPVTVWLVVTHFSPDLQGYYYTFASLLALQVFVDLGLVTVIIQFASHEWSELGLDEQGRIVGSAKALSRLVSLGQVAFRWYAVAAVIVAIGLGLAGYSFFSQSPHEDIHWTAPWLALCVVTGLNLCFSPVWALLEGCNQVSRVYGFRLVQGGLVSLATWLAIGSGGGLWAATIAGFTGLVCGLIFLRRSYWPFCLQIMKSVPGPRISWRYELWPMQWKIALSWLSGYLFFSMFTPILFHYHGAVVAGQMGMTWSLVSMLSGVSATWAMSKAPQFGVLVAKKEYEQLDRLFYKLTIAALFIAACGAVAIWATIYLLYSFKYSLANRFLPPLPTAIFLAATVILQCAYPQGFYLRAHKQEPFLLLSIVSSLLIALTNWWFGSLFGATGMALGYLAVVAFSVPMGTLIWYRCRAAWHSDKPK